MHRESHAILFYRISIKVWEYRSQQPKINFQIVAMALFPLWNSASRFVTRDPVSPSDCRSLSVMFDLGRWGTEDDRRSASLGAVGRWILATATLAGVAAAAPKPPIITVGRALTVQRVAGTDGWRALPNWSGAGGVGAASSLRTSLRAIRPRPGAVSAPVCGD